MEPRTRRLLYTGAAHPAKDEELSLDRKWSREEICSYLVVPAEMLKTIKANERESEEMYKEWLKNNRPYLIGVDLASKPDQTVIRKVDGNGRTINGE